MDEAVLVPIFDDVGSFPLPEGVSKTDIRVGNPSERQHYLKLVEDAMWLKLKAGVDVPTYPQFRDMNRMFLDIIEDPSLCTEPLVVDERNAHIVELEAVERAARRWSAEGVEPPEVRVCITGPVELYLPLFGSSVYPDVLLQLAKSISAFVRHACTGYNLKVAAVCLDEPSLGLNPNIMFSEDDIIEALNRAAKGCNADVHVHLHSSLYYETACRSDIDVVGVECASNPSNLEMVDMKTLDETDTHLRVGIARSDIHSLAAQMSERYETNVWNHPELLERLVSEVETPEVIAARLERAVRMFGDRISYAGPDCGLGSWPSQKIAAGLLGNVHKAIDMWRDAKIK
ncbi:MAG: methionine synthase [Methermicoccaceae archaeon]